MICSCVTAAQSLKNMYSFSSGISKNLSQGNDHRYEQWVCNSDVQHSNT